MAFYSLSWIFVFILWGYGFMLIERRALLSGMVAVACFILPISIFTANLEYVTESSGTLASATLGLSATTKSQAVLVDVFFLFIALMNLWMVVGESRRAKREV